MHFTDSIFLFYFLPFALIAHRLAVRQASPGDAYPVGARLLLVLVTAAFYGFHKPWWLLPFALTIVLDFLWASLISKADSEHARKRIVVCAIATSLLQLGFFKYWGFFASSAHALFPSLPALPQHALEMPAGISFYTFESLSFVIDIYRRQITIPRSPLEFLSFIAMFPRFIAGPIVRYKDIRGQLADYRGMAIEQGLFLFLQGLFLKVCFADSFSIFVPYAFEGIPANTLSAWLGVLAYTFQIYFDFQGYSLMAIGLGLCLGFKFPANFNRPYLALSLQDFWRRWHITLSTWLRDYLYIPLGGSQGPGWKTYRNLMLTMTLGGLWHGASVTFILWGVWHGALLCLERYGSRLSSWRPPPALMWLMTFVAVTQGWVLFKSSSLHQAIAIFKMLWIPAGTMPQLAAIQNYQLAAGLCVFGILYAFIFENRGFVDRAWQAFILYMATLALLFSQWRVPFLYFQF